MKLTMQLKLSGTDLYLLADHPHLDRADEEEMKMLLPLLNYIWEELRKTARRAAQQEADYRNIVGDS